MGPRAPASHAGAALGVSALALAWISAFRARTGRPRRALVSAALAVGAVVAGGSAGRLESGRFPLLTPRAGDQGRDPEAVPIVEASGVFETDAEASEGLLSAT